MQKRIIKWDGKQFISIMSSLYSQIEKGYLIDIMDLLY